MSEKLIKTVFDAYADNLSACETVGGRLGVLESAIRAAFKCRPAPAAQVPDGMALVPVEPTQEMLAAAAPFPEHLRLRHPDDKTWEARMQAATAGDQMVAAQTYRKMLAAAPAPATVATEDGARRNHAWEVSGGKTKCRNCGAMLTNKTYGTKCGVYPFEAVAQDGGVDAEKVMALVEALEHAEAWVSEQAHGDNCFLHNDGGEFDRCFCGKDWLLVQIERALLSAPPAASGWVAVSDRLPPSNQTVALLMEGDVILTGWAVYWHPSGEFSEFVFPLGNPDELDVIAWCALPPAIANQEPK